MNTIIQFFTQTDKLRSFTDGIQQEGGHENLGNFAYGYG